MSMTHICNKINAKNGFIGKILYMFNVDKKIVKKQIKKVKNKLYNSCLV